MMKRMFSKLPSRSSTRRGLLVGMMFLPLFAAIHFASYWLRFDGNITPRRWVQLTCTLLGVLLIKSIVFASYRIYQSWSRYLTFYDLMKLTQAATLSAVVFALFDYLLLAWCATPRSVFFMDWGATIVVVGGLRATRRWMQEGSRLFRRASGTPVVIVGADDHGEALLRMIRCNQNLRYHVVGFIAESPATVGSCIGGVPVVGTIEDIFRLASHYGVNEILIAAGRLSGEQVRKLLQDAGQCQVIVKVLPSYEQLLKGNVDLRPRTVSITDLLRRDPVQLDMHNLHQWLDGQVLLVTGAAGSIGAEICRQLLQFAPRKLVVVDRSENGQFFLEQGLRQLTDRQQIEVCVGDIADQERMAEIFRAHRPDIVIHAAAYKHVPLMEINCGEAIRNIPLATKCLADLADEFDVASFVMISTDKAVNPTSVMGASKRLAEIYVQALAQESKCQFVTVRFGNVLDSAGSVVPIFRSQIAQGGPVLVTHPDMKRYFMTIPEASQLVIQAGAMGQGGEIFVLDMGAPIRIIDLAQDMIRLSGLRIGQDIEIKFSGVRPGEKLFEELHIHGEKHLPTSHPKIVIAVCQPTALVEITAALSRFQRIRGNDAEIVAELMRIVPEYKPSRFGGLQRRAA